MLLSGRPPFDGDTDEEIFKAVAKVCTGSTARPFGRDCVLCSLTRCLSHTIAPLPPRPRFPFQRMPSVVSPHVLSTSFATCWSAMWTKGSQQSSAFVVHPRFPSTLSLCSFSLQPVLIINRLTCRALQHKWIQRLTRGPSSSSGANSGSSRNGSSTSSSTGEAGRKRQSSDGSFVAEISGNGKSGFGVSYFFVQKSYLSTTTYCIATLRYSSHFCVRCSFALQEYRVPAWGAARAARVKVTALRHQVKDRISCRRMW